MSDAKDGSWTTGKMWKAFEQETAALCRRAEQSVAAEPLMGFAPGDSVRVIPPDGSLEVDGVPARTRGVFEGIVRLGDLRPLAAVSLDDNGEIVLVRLGAVARI